MDHFKTFNRFIFEKLYEPLYFYHGTKVIRLNGILKNGLGSGQKDTDTLCVTSSLEDAEYYSIRKDKSEPAILRFKNTGIFKKVNAIDEYEADVIINPDDLEIKDGDNWIRLTDYMKLNEEYQQDDVSLLESLDDYFTIGFEIELDTDHRRINSLPRPPKNITYLTDEEADDWYKKVIKESKKLEKPSISDRKKIMDIKSNFPNLWKEHFYDMDYHYEESVQSGIEIVSKPFTSLEKAKNFIRIFFQDYKKQNKWFFTDKTSIHINIGVRKRPKSREWKIVKGVIMLSDDYTFKNIESRRTSGWCNSLKSEVGFQIRLKNDKEFINSKDINEIERGMRDIIKKTVDSPIGNKKWNINFSKLFTKGYVEFRPVGGLLSEPIVIDKMMYFIYCVYLMTSSYKEQEYHEELLKFIEDIKQTID